MKGFKHYLAEGLSPVVFHATGVESILDILETDKFLLTTTVGTPSDKISKHFYYLSTARSPASDYFKYHGSGYLVLDGRSLNQRYAAKSLNYWATPSDTFGNKDEFEDRLVTDQPTIPSARKYILEIHILTENLDLENDDLRAANTKRRIRKIILHCAKKNIPLFFYRDRAAYIARNKLRAVDIDIPLLKTTNTDKNWSSNFRDKHFDVWIELAKAPTYQKLSDEGKRKAGHIARHEYMDSWVTQLKNDFSKLSLLLIYYEKIVFNLMNRVMLDVNKFYYESNKRISIEQKCSSLIDILYKYIDLINEIKVSRINSESAMPPLIQLSPIRKRTMLKKVTKRVTHKHNNNDSLLKNFAIRLSEGENPFKAMLLNKISENDDKLSDMLRKSSIVPEDEGEIRLLKKDYAFYKNAVEFIRNELDSYKDYKIDINQFLNTYTENQTALFNQEVENMSRTISSVKCLFEEMLRTNDNISG